MSFFNHHKKIFSLIITITLVFLIYPQKAGAVVPVADLKAEASLAKLALTETKEEVKETILDRIGWIAAKMIIRQMTDSIVAWIKNGFESPDGSTGPMFITNPKQFLSDVANQGSAIVLRKIFGPGYTALCSPWKLDLYLSMQRTQPVDIKMACTMRDVIAEFDKFYASFLEGGWAAWIHMTDNAQNNPYGAYLTTVDAVDKAMAAEKETAKTDAAANQGFLGMRKCVAETTEDGCDPTSDPAVYQACIDGAGKCTRYENTTPGRLILAQAEWSQTSWVRSLEIADEIDEIAAALVTQIMKMLIESGAGGMTDSIPAAPPGTPTPGESAEIEAAGEALIEKVDDIIAQENNYKTIKTNSTTNLASATSTLTSAITCYLATSTACAIEIDNASATIISLNTQASGINTDIASADSIIAQSGTLITDIAAATTTSQMTEHAQTFSDIYNLSHTSTDIINAEGEKTIIDTALASARAELIECQSGTASCLE